jgi:3-isopropylmalate dehydrogenase
MLSKAVEQTLNDGYRTGEIYKDGMKKVGTAGMRDAVIARL